MADDTTLPGTRPPAAPTATRTGADPNATLAPSSPPGIDATRNDSRAGGIGPVGVVVLPGYEVHGEVARGGMGRVLAATDVAFGRQVAVKVLLPAADPAEAAARFVREARITGQLAHPGIPPVHHLGADAAGSPFLAMKLVRGRTLEDLLRARPNPAADQPRYVQVFEQICQAVGFAHSQGVVHRDLKPGNVMVGAFGEVQVMDWGLARGNDESGMMNDEWKTATNPAPGPVRDSSFIIHHSSLTVQGSVLGTPAYMAPEQARGEDVDARADVFALGGVLASILVGRTPFGRSDVKTTLVQAAAGDTAEVLAAIDACPADAELKDVARRCLAPYRDDRPADGTAVADLVAAYRAGVEQRLRRAERDRAAAEAQAAEQRKRRKVQLALVGAVALLVVGGGAAAWRHDRQEAYRDQVERDQAAAAFRQQVEDEKRGQAERDRAARAADAVAGLLDRAGDALRASDADRAAPFLDQAAARAKDDGVPDPDGRLAAYRADLDVLRELDRIDSFRWTPVEGKLPPGGAVVGRYAAAFAGYGVAPGAAPPAEAAARIARSPVRAALLVGLDAWLVRQPTTPLRDLLAAADQDPFRDEVRAALVAADPTALAALAARPEWAAQPPGLVRAFGDAAAVPADTQRALLTRAALARPTDFGLLMDAAGSSREGAADAHLRWLQAAVAVRPGNVAAWYNLGTALGTAGDKAGSEVCFREALRLDPRNAMAHTNLGTVLRGRGDPKGAEACFREAIRLDPALATAHNNLGIMLKAQGDLDGAVACFREAIRVDPDYAQAHNHLGAAMIDRRDLTGAIRCFREAVRVDPAHAMGHFNLGTALRAKGDLAGALDSYREAVRINPGFVQAYFNMGNALAVGGDLDGAIRCFEEVVRLDPKFAPGHASLARAREFQAAVRRPVAPPPRPVNR